MKGGIKGKEPNTTIQRKEIERIPSDDASDHTFDQSPLCLVHLDSMSSPSARLISRAVRLSRLLYCPTIHPSTSPADQLLAAD